MPFGIGLPNPIEESLNRIPGVGSFIDTEEEEERKRRRKKRPTRVPETKKKKKEKDEYDLKDVAKDLLIPGRAFGKVGGKITEVTHAPKIIRSIPRNVSDLGAGIIPAAGIVGRAAWHDLRHPQSGMDMARDYKDYLNLARWTIADEKGDKKKRPKTDSELAGLVAEFTRAWGRGIEKAIPNPTDPDDVKEAKQRWTEEPVFAALDVVPVAGALGRIGSAAKLATSIKRANEISTLGAARAGIRESYRPGTAAKAELKGGIEPRIHEVTINGKTIEVPGRPWSRQPLMREGQRYYDALFARSQKLSERRVGRVEQRLAAERKRRTELGAQELSQTAAHLVYGKLGRMVGAFGLKKNMSAAERYRATALGYAFQMPKHMDPEDALAAVQHDLEQIVNRGKIELPRGNRVKEVSLRADQKQALVTQISDLEKARHELATGGISKEEFSEALEHLSRMADQTRKDGLEIMQRRYNLDADEMASLEASWDNRASILPRRLEARGHLGMDLADSVERKEWLDMLTRQLSPEEAEASIAISDAIARAIRPDDPASFYRDRVGRPTRETAEAFADRMQQTGGQSLQQLAPTMVGRFEPGYHRLIETRAEAAGHSLFYSPLQKWVDEAMPETMQAGQLRAALMKNIPEAEYHATGLEMYFDSLDYNAKIAKGDFQNFLANPLNAYNLREVHRINHPDFAFDPDLVTKYDVEHQGNYITREPSAGEYHEVTFELPGPTARSAYTGKGKGHWNRDNVTVHFRFHDFVDEDGTRKLVIEEIQSDWANQFRDQTKEGRIYRDLTPDEQADLDNLKTEIEDMRGQKASLSEERQSLADGGDDATYYELTDQIDDLTQQIWEAEQGFDWYRNQFGAGDIPPPPVGMGYKAGQSFANAPVRWIQRYAVENGVDEVVLISREAQLVRNAKAIDPREWLNFKDGNAEDLTAYLRENMRPGQSYMAYDKDLPILMEREFGSPGVKSDRAYTGEYRVYHDSTSGSPGWMPGTVWKVDDEFRAGVERAKSMYQKRPTDQVAKGATEFLSSGRAIRIFEEGDVSTWIHELGHTAMYDLPEQAQKVLRDHYGQGKGFDDWEPMQHESFARDFENYVRGGRAPNKPLAAVFTRLSNWIKEIWKAEDIRKGNIDPKVREVFDEMFAAPPNRETYGYFPHRDFTEIAQQEYRGGVRPPAAGETFGIPRLDRATLNRNGNEMYLYQSGRLSPDPAQLVDVFLRRTRFKETLEARDEMWEIGQPLTEAAPPKGSWLIRNPDEAAERIRPEVRAGVRGQPTTLPSRGEDLEALEGKLVGDADDIRKEMIARPGEHPEWASDLENTRWVPGEYVESRFGEVFESRPRGGMWSALGLMNSMQRTTGIYGRPIAYVAGNIPFNVLSLMTQMPLSTLRSSVRAMRIRAKDPELYNRIASETGETRATGGLPDFYTRPTNRLQEAEQRATTFQRGMADVLSKVADSPFRVTAFLNNAAKRGYHSNKELSDLIREGGHELSDIRQLTREQMLDFDALNPSNRRIASQFLYLWPFIYASMKWPLMFAREYPARAALAAQGAQLYGEDAPEAIADLWQKYGVDLSTVNPVGPMGDWSEQITKFIDDPSKMDFTFLQDRLSPTLGALVEGMGGGREHAFQNYLRQSIPLASEIASFSPEYRGGKQYADRSQRGYLLQRHLRFWPRGVNKEVIKERVEKYLSDRNTTDTSEAKRNEDKAKINKYVQATGGWTAEEGEQIQRSYDSWWAYQEAVDEKKEQTGQRKLTPVQQAKIVNEIIRQYYPEVADQLVSEEDLDNAKDMDSVTEYVENVKEYINEGRTMVFNEYRSLNAD